MRLSNKSIVTVSLSVEIASLIRSKVSKELETKFNMMNFDYDFSEFEKDIEDAIISSEVLTKLKASLSNPSVQTTILTARTEGEPVINFFKGDEKAY